MTFKQTEETQTRLVNDCGNCQFWDDCPYNHFLTSIECDYYEMEADE